MRALRPVSPVSTGGTSPTAATPTTSAPTAAVGQLRQRLAWSRRPSPWTFPEHRRHQRPYPGLKYRGASLTGTSGSSAGGTITFYLDGPGAAPSTCPGSPGWAQLGAVIAVTGDATYDPSVGYTPTAPGDYWWYADYSGDADNLGANSACGRVETVVQTSESLGHGTASGTLNNAVAPTATLSGPITREPRRDPDLLGLRPGLSRQVVLRTPPTIFGGRQGPLP